MSVTPEKYHPRKIIAEIVPSPKNVVPTLRKIPKLANKPHYEVPEFTENNNSHCKKDNEHN